MTPLSEKELHILLLGTPAILWEKRSLRIPRRLTRALLYYLAFTEQPTPRSQLILLFWPDASEQDGRRRLREILSKLRLELPDPDVLVVEQENLSLDPNRINVDGREFLKQSERVRENIALSDHATMSDGTHQQAVRAALLWRSNRFMDGFVLAECEGYQEWLEQTGSALEMQRINLLVQLADHHLGAREPRQAVRWLRSALAIDELDLDVHLRLLGALQELGSYREAITHFEQLSQMYKREGLGNLPNNLQKIYARLCVERTLPPASRRTPWPLPVELGSPFVGREHLLDQFKKQFPSGGMVVLMGEIGSGKSRLLYECCQMCFPNDRLLVTCGNEMAKNMPLQPLIDMLRRDVQTGEWDQLSPHWLALLKVIFPDLKSPSQDVVAHKLEMTDGQHALLFEAIHQILLVLAKRKRLVIVLDDAQWADQTTYSFLAYLLKNKFFQNRNLLLLACRMEDSHAYLDELIQEQSNDCSINTFELEDLKGEDITILVRSMLGSKPDPDFVQRLARETGGNPLIILETLQAFLAANIDPSSANSLGGFPIPSSIRNLILNRMRLQSSTARNVLSTAAIMGMEFSSVALARATGIPMERLVNILEELERHHAIRTYSGPDPSFDYTFIHNTVREICISSLSPARLHLIHKNVARVLEQEDVAVESNPAVLAWHHELAHDPEQAFDYWLKTGRHACQLLSTLEASQAFTRAERQMHLVSSSLTDRQIYELYSSWANMSLDVSNMDAMQDCALKMVVEGRKRNSGLLIGAALSILANFSIHKNDPSTGLSTAQEALHHLKRSNDLYEMILAYNRQGMCQQLLLDMDGAVESFQKANKLGLDASDWRIMDAKTNSLSDESLLHIFLGFPEKALHVAQQAISLSQVTGNLARQARAYVPIATALEMMSDIPSAYEAALTGIDICERILAAHTNAYLHVTAARNEFRLGKVDAALERYDKMEGLIKDRFPEILASGLHAKGYFFLRMGMLPEATSFFEKGMNIQLDKIQSAKNAYSLAYCLGLAGKTGKALQMLDDMIESSLRSHFGFIHFHALINKSRLLVKLGRLEEAEQLLLQVKAECKPRKFWEHVIVCNLDLGQLELARKNCKTALKYGASVMRHAAHHQHIWHELDALLLEWHCLAKNDPRQQENMRRRMEILKSIRQNCRLPQFQASLDALEKAHTS
jgi:predicted ATPase/DNA-binding SARP family transcriptional activator